MALPGELPDGRLPICLITGFLGSGKTTVLNRLLADPRMKGTAVLVNEFGEVGIDNLLVSEVRGDLMLLTSGCICCEYLGELADSVKDLFARREAGEIPRFERVLLETTGLADPIRLVDTSMNDPAMSLLVYLDSVAVTVDAVLGRETLAAHPESLKQVALADRLLVTKSDLAGAEATAALVDELARINPTAPVRSVVKGAVAPEDVLGAGTMGGEGSARDARVAEWLAVRARDETAAAGLHGAIRTFTVRLENRVAFPRFASWFSRLVRTEGSRILRVKGLLATTDDPRPLVVQSVQWILCPTHRLDAWPDADESSRIVFIARDLPDEDAASIRSELAEIARASATPPEPPPREPARETAQDAAPRAGLLARIAARLRSR